MEIVIIVSVIFLAVVIACLIIARSKSKHLFECKACHKEFYPEWHKLVFTTHAENEFEITCPYCKTKGCLEKKDKSL